jgi:broad specificity phosphatase PhoE
VIPAVARIERPGTTAAVRTPGRRLNKLISLTSIDHEPLPEGSQAAMILYCVRHGQSTYNAEGRIQGQSDVPLSDLGRRQGEAVAAVLAELPIDAIYSSPMRRAMQTAQPSADALRLEIRTDPRLKEIHAGLWEDKLRSEVEQRFPEQIARWRSGDLDLTIPGGESRRDLMRRGRAALDAIFRASHRQVVVFAHGGLLICTLKALLDIPTDQPPFDLLNGSISKLSVGSDGKLRVLWLDQVDHLRQAGLGGDGDL